MKVDKWKDLKEMGWLYCATLAPIAVVLWVIALLNYSEPISAKEWLLTGIPAWLQGLGTAGAAFFAWRAYSSWQTQEAWRRKALAAENILRSSYVLVDAIRNARVPRSKAQSGMAAALGEISKRREEVAKVTRALAELKNHQLYARHYRYGSLVENGLSGLCNAGMTVEAAHAALRPYFGVYSSTELSLLSGASKERVMNSYSTLIRGSEADEIERQLRDSTEKIQSGLESFVKDTLA